MPTDPTPADLKRARALVAAILEESAAEQPDDVWQIKINDVARALATARTDADAAGYARGRADGERSVLDVDTLARADYARRLGILDDEDSTPCWDDVIAAAEAKGRAEGLREAANLVSGWHIKRGGYSVLAEEIRALAAPPDPWTPALPPQVYAPEVTPGPRVGDTAEVEREAERIYNGWREKAGFKPWVPGGNSDAQDHARGLARAALARVGGGGS